MEVLEPPETGLEFSTESRSEEIIKRPDCIRSGLDGLGDGEPTQAVTDQCYTSHPYDLALFLRGLCKLHGRFAQVGYRTHRKCIARQLDGGGLVSLILLERPDFVLVSRAIGCIVKK